MEYVLLIYSDETAPSSPELEQEMWAAHGVYGQMLEEHGVVRGGGAALHPGPRRLSCTDPPQETRVSG